jgi:hypothetical protein
MGSEMQRQKKTAKPLRAPLTSAATRILQHKCACGGTPGPTGECEACRKKKLQRHPSDLPAPSTINHQPSTASQVPPIVHEVLCSPGQPLDIEMRAFMEPRFRQDFSQVRIHTGTRANESARAVNARAYTVGEDLAFDSGAYSPGTASGRQLIAHELTHVLQQRGAAHAVSAAVSPSGQHFFESEAEQMASLAEYSSTLHVQGRGTANGLQRAAPAAAAVGIGALAAKCIIGAIIGVLVDLGIQGALHAWRARTWRFWEMTVDVCSVILSAILGCLGGVVAAKWVEPWINSALGTRLGGIAGSLIGKILIFIANKLTIGVPRAMVKTLLKLNCISHDQAEVLAPGVGTAVTSAEEPAAGTGREEEAVA